jgi:opacity protein-like surface antigen
MSSTLGTSAYVGGSVGRSDYDVSCIGGQACDRNGMGLKLFAGARINEMFGAELSYIHLGDVELGGGGDSRAHGVNASLVAGFPVSQSFSVNGKVGGTYGWTRVGGAAAFGGGRSDGLGLSYGLGLDYRLTPNVGVRLDWDRHRFDFTRGNENVDLLSIGVQYRFQ